MYKPLAVKGEIVMHRGYAMTIEEVGSDAYRVSYADPNDDAVRYEEVLPFHEVDGYCPDYQAEVTA